MPEAGVERSTAPAMSFAPGGGLDSDRQEVQPDPGTWIAALGSLPLLAQPGERWLYNTGASVLGVLLARAAGEPFADVLRTRIFEPLGMHDTGFWTSQAHRLPTAYRPGADGLQVCDTPDGDWSRPPAFGDGAAGLVSTADGFLAFSRMLLRGGDPVLSAGAVTEMTRDQLTPAQKAVSGFGTRLARVRGARAGCGPTARNPSRCRQSSLAALPRT